MSRTNPELFGCTRVGLHSSTSGPSSADVNCGIDDVTQEAARRGLFHPRPYGSGLLEILGDIAAAERLPESVNDYPEARRQLRRSALTDPLESGHGLQLLDRPDDEFVIA